MANLCATPSEALVKSLLEPLFAADTSVTVTDDIPVDTSYIGNYIDDQDVPIAACIADVEMVVYGGSIMMMIPKGGAEDAVEEKAPSDVMQECFYEVANILTRAVMDDNSEHLRLEKVYAPGTNTEIVSGLGDAVDKFSVKIDVPGYGAGTITFIYK